MICGILGGIIDYLADVVDLLDCISLQEKYVVTIAGFYMRKKIEMSKLANESSEKNLVFNPKAG